jgi:hypothetical protein
MKPLLIIFFGLSYSYGLAQELNINYRATAIDSIERFHYLLFTDNSNCKLIYPIQNHGDAMVRQQREFDLTYRVSHDTITFQGTDLDSANPTINRLLKSKFLISEEKLIFDPISGCTYVDNELVSDKYIIYSIDGKIYKQRIPKSDGYGLVRKSYKTNRRLKKRMKQMNPDNCEITVLRGKAAYDKYGAIGVSGVVEVVEKK